MRTLAATAAVVLALTGCAAPPSGPPPTADPLDPVDATASPTPAPTPTEEPSPEPSTTPETPEEVPTSTDDLPDIWVEISALYAQVPAETRDQTCMLIHTEETADAAVLMWQLDYKNATGEEADPGEVRTVLLWLCESNT
ncbi:hypothetical protein [Nocardiopsis synnemataformans]|uniref:hypothetical protein n=1 Tax=Nocardiopsis synnemataformans TaxID=61305 RepID=UPI003EBF79B5